MKWSYIISAITHPFSLLLVGVFIVFKTNTYINFSYPDELKLIVYSMIAINTMALPVFFAWYLTAKGHVKSIAMDDITDRKLMYFFTFLLYIITQFILSTLEVPAVVYKFSFGATLTIGMLFVFALFRQKISAHMSGLGGLVGFLAMARMKMKAHREREIYIGFLLGFFSQVFLFS